MLSDASNVGVIDNDLRGGGDDGVVVGADADAVSVSENVVKGYGDDGIDNGAGTTIVAGNTANRNGDYGIVSSSGAFTFDNVARNNGNPDQCVPVTGCNQ